jgi:hypothetical protein
MERARDSLLAAADALPRGEEVRDLRERFGEALSRGYFTPDEDEAIRAVYGRYLHVRGALHETLHSLRRRVPRLRADFDGEGLRAFALGWLAACTLMRAARYLVREFQDLPLLCHKLNEPDPLHGIPANSLDQIHRASTRPRTLVAFLRAARFAEEHRPALLALSDDPCMREVLEWLAREEPFIERERRAHAKAYARHTLARWRATPARQYRKVMWGLFKASGQAIAECRNPFHRKRVNRRVRKLVSETLEPGDVLVTRHDDALSNLFLPGFWPHAALVIGHAEQRDGLGVACPPEQAARCQPPICILEAKKDGVRFRALRETLAVDAFVLLRPRFADPSLRREVVQRALAHEGKPYDFEFDFRRADRLVCTGVVYRSFDGRGGVGFQLTHRAGRPTLSAEDLLRQALASGTFDVVLLFGLAGNRLLRGERALSLLRRSLASNV